MNIVNQYHPQFHPHPGETLAEKMDEMNVTPLKLSYLSGISEQTIINLINGNGSIDSIIAQKLEKATKIPARFWINHQQGYDEISGRNMNKN
jgi:HTH-type transcriptional regulator/antitoxin HigA